MPSKDLMPLRTDRQPIGYSNELVGRAGEAPMPGVAEAVVAVREPLQPGTPEGWCNPRPRRRNVPQQLLRIKFLGKADACLAALHPGNRPNHAEFALAEQDRSPLDRQLVTFHQSSIGAEVAQLHRQ